MMTEDNEKKKKKRKEKKEKKKKKKKRNENKMKIFQTSSPCLLMEQGKSLIPLKKKGDEGKVR